MTDQFLDPMSPQSDTEKMSIDEAVERLGVTRRTVYRVIEREGFEKVEGTRGRVWYLFPKAFIEQYIEETQADRKTIIDMTPPVISQPLPMSYATPRQDTAQPVTDISRVIDKTLELADKVLMQSEKINEMSQELERKKSELQIINREMESRNTAIARYRDQDQEKNRLEVALALQKEKADRLEAENAELKKQQAKPWWKF